MPNARSDNRANAIDRRRGFSLVEAVMAVAIVATMLVGVLAMVGASAGSRVLQKEQARGASLARQLLEEIMQCRYADPDAPPVFGPETGETRPTFDDVDDFDNWQESPPQSSGGAPLPGYSGWGRKVTVKWVDLPNLSTSPSTDTGLKRIAVVVTSPTGKITTLFGLRSRYSAYDKTRRSQDTFASWAGLTVQVGANPGTAASSSVNLVNQVP